MVNATALYGRYIAISARAQMQYRASFLMMAVGHLLVTAGEFAGLWALFARFGSLRGWRLPEVALLYGLVSVAFGLSEGVARGFDVFPSLIRTGEFDRILLRPRSTALQVLGPHLQLMRVGRLAQGVLVLGWAARALDVTWSAPAVLLAAASVAGGACLFTGLLVVQATLSFWTTESLEVMNCLTYGGVETAQFPIAVYRPWFRRFFTFVVPLACISYFPAHAILGRPDALGSPVWFQWAAPLVGVAFLLVTLQFWRVGVRHYRSTGS